MAGLGAMGAMGGLPSDLPGAGRGLGPMAQHADPSTSNATTSGSLGLASNGLRSNTESTESPYIAARLRPPPDMLASVSEFDDPSYETIPSGSRSPGEESDLSQFTSISQRGVNPNWRPPPPSAHDPMPSYDGADYGPIPRVGPQVGGYGNTPLARPRGNRQEDLLLAQASDFSIPGVGPPGRGRRGGMRDGAMRGRGAPIGLQGAASQGRYPNEI